MKKIMNKKLVCLFLSLVMLLSVCLTACGQKSDDEASKDITEKASDAAETLAMYLMSEAPVSEETANKIEEAVNKITESKFRTHLELYFYTEEEYYGKLNAAFDARDAAAANGTLDVYRDNTDSEDSAKENETYVDEYGLVQIKYPTIADYQVDIFYLGGVDRFNEYMSRGLLLSLDSELGSASQVITEYVSPQFLSTMKSANGGTYALPSNQAIGDYTYLLLNKEALKAAYRGTENGTTDFSAYTSLTCEDAEDFIHFVNNTMRENYIPLYTNMTSTEMLFTNLKFWGVDENNNLSDAFSILGDYFNNSDTYLGTNAYAEMSNLFENDDFLYDLEVLKGYESCYATANEEGKKFAVGYVKGGAELVEQYGDEYEMIVVESPRLTEEELYSNLFAVNSYTRSSADSMEILSYLNTNVDFRNLILYGIEGEHYRIIESEQENALGEKYKVAERLNESYIMDEKKTGNTFLAYPLKGELVNIRDYGRKQNQDAKVELSLGFVPTYNEFVVNTEHLQTIRALSAKIWADYLVCTDFDAFLTQAQADIAACEVLALQFSPTHLDEEGAVTTTCDKNCGSLICSYQAWLVAKGIVKAK